MCQTLYEAPCIPYLILTITFCCSDHCYSYFTDEQTEAERNQGEAICPRPQKLMDSGFDPRQSDSTAQTLHPLSYIDYC